MPLVERYANMIVEEHWKVTAINSERCYLTLF